MADPVVVLTNPTGRAWEVNSINGDAPAQMHHVGWGTGAGVAAVGDTALFGAATEARVTATLAKPTTTTWKITATLVAESNQTVTNVGVFDDAVAGNMGIHASFDGEILEAGDSITFEITRSYPA